MANTKLFKAYCFVNLYLNFHSRPMLLILKRYRAFFLRVEFMLFDLFILCLLFITIIFNISK